MKKRSLILCGLADIGHRQPEQDLGTGLALEAVKEKVPEAAGSRRVDGNPGMEKVCPNENPGWRIMYPRIHMRAACAAGLFITSTLAASSTKPNILFAVSDDASARTFEA